MKQVKIISGPYLEEKINNFLMNNEEIYDIKLYFAYGHEVALIIYKNTIKELAEKIINRDYELLVRLGKK